MYQPTSAVAAPLEVRSLHLWRGDRHVLRGLSFVAPAGRALQIAWPNGAGKTSLLRALGGLLRADSGEIFWQGVSIFDDLRRFHVDVAFFSHELGLKGDLTADENLRLIAGLRRRHDGPARAAALAQVGLAGLGPSPARQLSAGQQRRVALARLLLQGASLWLLDEPAAHLDAQGQRLVASLITAHARAGGTALIATHQPLDLPTDIAAELPPPSARAAVVSVT